MLKFYLYVPVADSIIGPEIVYCDLTDMILSSDDDWIGNGDNPWMWDGLRSNLSQAPIVRNEW